MSTIHAPGPLARLRTDFPILKRRVNGKVQRFDVFSFAKKLGTHDVTLKGYKPAHIRKTAEPHLSRLASEEYGYPAGWIARYFEQLRYSFGPRERQGLLRFLELAHDAGELERVPDFRFVREEVPA